MPLETPPGSIIHTDNLPGTFADISARIGNASLDLHVFRYPDGRQVNARRKVTYRAGLVHTAYLHIVVQDTGGRTRRYRETADGNFRQV